MAGVIERLCDRPYEFGFMSAVGLLDEYFRSVEKTADPLAAGRVRVSGDTSIAFPSADVAGCRRGSDGSVRLIAAFMGLTGAVSPLPHYFTEQTLRPSPDNDGLRDFLDIFARRLYSLFYQAWRLCHPAVSPTPFDHPFGSVLKTVAGAIAETGSDSASRTTAVYAGILAGGRRSAAGLAVMLTDIFGGIPVRVYQHVGRWAPLPTRPALGAGIRLGDSAVMGKRYWDTESAFRVVLGPLSRPEYERFLPGKPDWHRMADIIRDYLPSALAFRIETVLAAPELVQVVLGTKSDARLGHTACLGSPHHVSEMGREVVVISEWCCGTRG